MGSSIQGDQVEGDGGAAAGSASLAALLEAMPSTAPDLRPVQQAGDSDAVGPLLVADDEVVLVLVLLLTYLPDCYGCLPAAPHAGSRHRT